MYKFSRKNIEDALRAVIADQDYDLHKGIETNEETGEDDYPKLVDIFLEYGILIK